MATQFANDREQLSNYFYEWLTQGPMFGRETSDHFVDLGRQKSGTKTESWQEMKKKAEKRLQLLQHIPLQSQNTYLQYQQDMEEFYISFFENQLLFQDAYELAKSGEIQKATEVLKKSNPDETIRKYANAIKPLGFTPGEKALVFSMNTRWKADFINLRQQLGLEPVRFKFAPTQHDSLAQAPGQYSYFIDKNKNWWRCLWKHELENMSFIENNSHSFLRITHEFDFDLKSIHGQNIPSGYVVMVGFNIGGEVGTLDISDGEVVKTAKNSIQLECKNGKLKILNLQPQKELLIESITINQE